MVESTRSISALAAMALLSGCAGVVHPVLADPTRGGTTLGGPAGQTVHFLGRFDFSTPGEAAFEWSGSGIDARFEGTGVAARLKGPGGIGYLEVVIDDGAPREVTFSGASPTIVPLASGLPPGPHHVELYRRTEARMGTQRFLGFIVTGGALVASPPPFSRRIEFIGDSITAGFGNQGKAPCSFSFATEDDTLTYGALTARALGAERHSIAWSGIGMYRGYGEATPSSDTMPLLYERTLPSDPASRWDFTRWIPDVVVIDLGTNDFWSTDPLDDPTPQYTARFLAFLEKLRARAPRAEVFCAMGPMSDHPRWKAALQSIVSTRHAQGDPRVHFLQFAVQVCGEHGLGCGCDWHPTPATHQAMADALVPAIRAVTGW